MQLFPPAVIPRLDTLVGQLRSVGLLARRKDVVGALVLYRVPATAPQLASMVRRYLVAHAATARGRRGNDPLMLTLPPPVSLRIDLLVEVVREQGLRAYRKDLLGALVMQRAPSSKQLSDDFRRYRQAQARDAQVSGYPLSRVLTLKRPDPGPRPAP